MDINNRTSAAVDLIISAHSHQTYNCLLSDPAGNPRLVTQAGFYGRLVTDIRLMIDGETGDVDRLCGVYEAINVPVTREAPDQAVADVVSYWDAQSAEEGNRVVGEATEDIRRAGSVVTGTDGQPTFVATRDAESSLGNLVAEMQLEALQDPTFGDPVVAFMNPGGLRTDIEGGPVTYAELFAVQPFGNTVNVITLTGADIRGVLEQQFQVGGPRGNTLRLGTSEGFSYDFDAAQPYGQRVDPASILLDPDGSGPLPAAVVDPLSSYRVVANSFLVTGGDSFTAFTNGTDPATGPVDVDTAVEYFEARTSVAPPAADHGQPTTFTTPPPPATGLGGSTGTPAPVLTVDAVSGALGVGAAGFTCPEPDNGGPIVPPATPGTDTPDPTPPATPVPTTPTTPTTVPVAAGSGTGSGWTGGGSKAGGSKAGGSLAYTGVPVGQMLSLAGALVAAGGLAIAAGYRRRRGLAD